MLLGKGADGGRMSPSPHISALTAALSPGGDVCRAVEFDSACKRSKASGGSPDIDATVVGKRRIASSSLSVYVEFLPNGSAHGVSGKLLSISSGMKLIVSNGVKCLNVCALTRSRERVPACESECVCVSEAPVCVCVCACVSACVASGDATSACMWRLSGLPFCKLR